MATLGAYVALDARRCTDDRYGHRAALEPGGARAGVVVCLGRARAHRGRSHRRRGRPRWPASRRCRSRRTMKDAACATRERGFRLTPNNLRQVRVPAGAEVLRQFGRARRRASGSRSAARVDSHARRAARDEGDLRAIMWRRASPPRVGAARRARSAHLARRSAWASRTSTTRSPGSSTALAGVTLHFRIAYPENLVTGGRAPRRGRRATVERLDAERARAPRRSHLRHRRRGLAEVIGRRLVASKATLGVAESCTGGLIGQLRDGGAGLVALLRRRRRSRTRTT